MNNDGKVDCAGPAACTVNVNYNKGWTCVDLAATEELRNGSGVKVTSYNLDNPVVGTGQPLTNIPNPQSP